jgi:hypothetical protein
MPLTHAIIGAEIGPCTTGETTLARRLCTLLDDGMLLLVDRVVEYTLSHPSRRQGEPPIRLITTLVDPTEAPAVELAAR